MITKVATQPAQRAKASMKTVEPHQLPGAAGGERRGIEVLPGARSLQGGAQVAAPPVVPLLGMAFPGDGQRTSAQQQDCDSRSAPQTRNQDASKRTETEERDVLVARARSGRKARRPAAIAERRGDDEIESHQSPH